MLSISVSATFPDLSHIELQVPCPICRVSTPVTMGRIRRQEMTICRGCHANVSLVDARASARRSQQKLERSFRDIAKALGG